MTPFVVGVAGGSGSGKTALCQALGGVLGPERVALLQQDAYYRDHGHLPPAARAARDFDAPEALDHELFVQHLAALRRGQPVRPPRYCFATHRRDGAGVAVEPRAILLVEGVLLFHDPAVRRQLDLRIFVDAPEAERLARRIRRDGVERGRTPASVVSQCLTTVFPAHARHVEPTRAWAHLVLLNGGRLAGVVEVAAAVIQAHLDRRPAPGAVRAA